MYYTFPTAFLMCTGYIKQEDEKKMPKCAVGTQRRHNPHIKVDFAAVAVVLFFAISLAIGLRMLFNVAYAQCLQIHENTWE